MKLFLRSFLSILMVLSLVFAVGCNAKNSGDVKNTNQTKKPIKIGYTGAMTGPYNEYGEGAKRSMLVVIKQWNDKGGINGRPIELITRDDQLDPNRGQINMKELLEDEKVDAVIGPPGSSVSLATVPLVEAKNIPFMNAQATSPLITYPNGNDKLPRKNAFNIYFPQNVETEVLAKFVAKNFKKIGLLYDSSAYGAGSSELQTKILKEKFGMAPVGSEKYDQKDTSMTAQLARLQKTGAEVILFSGLGPDAATIKKDMNRLGLNIPLVGTSGLAAKTFMDLVGPLAVGTIAPQVGVYSGNPPERPMAKKFCEDYLKMWGHDRWYGEGEWPQIFFIPTVYHDALNTLLEAMKRAGTTDGNTVINELNKLTNFEGVIANATFTPDNHNFMKPEDLTMYTFKLNSDGKTTTIVPYK